MKCNQNHEIKVFQYNRKYCIGTRDEYGPFCVISSEFNSKEEALFSLESMLNYPVICDICNKDSICKS